MRRTVGMLLTAIMIAACSGSDAAPEPLETAPRTTPAQSTVPPPTAVATDPPASEPDETTTTSEAPSTTIDEDAIRLARLEDDWRTGYAALMATLMDPADEALLVEALAYRADPNAESVRTFVAAYLEQGWRLTERGIAPVITIEIDPTLSADGMTATITTCKVNGLFVVETAGAPDGSDAIVDDSILATRSEEQLVFDGQWRVAQSLVLGQWKDVDECVG